MSLRTARLELSALAKDMAGLPSSQAQDLTASLIMAHQALGEAQEDGFRQRYARLFVAMSLGEARKLLELSEGATADEVSKAYKTKALKAHPDRGGSHEEMVDLNVARDLLLKDIDSGGGASSEDPDDVDEAAATDFLEKNFDGMKNGRGWWVSPNNLCINQTLLGICNLWVFTLLPFRAEAKAYNEKHNGIILHPAWRSTSDRDFAPTLDMIKRVYVAAKQSPTVQETVRKELNWIETKFQVQIPSDLEGRLVKEALATATRRWGADRLRMKDRFYPFDGSKPRDVGMWGL